MGTPENRLSFHVGIQQLERSAGQPNADIRLSTEIQRAVQAKLRDLGLDPHDTTGQELYRALGARLQADEMRFLQAILKGVKISDISHDHSGHIAFALNRELHHTDVFALKNTTARKLLKSNTPKKAMKALGYRSADSMLKQESVASLFAAATLLESDQWTKKLLAAFSKLKATDFETRPVAIGHPESARWKKLSEAAIKNKHHNVLTFKELGAVVLLPTPASDERTALPALSTAALAVHAVNNVIVASTYLKLHQAQPDFGTILKETVVHEPVLEDRLLDRPVSWSLLQQYYARLNQIGANVRSDLFEPFITTHDMVWHGVEQVLARIEPSLEFWLGTAHLGHLHDGHPVAFNFTDNILSHGHRLSYADRMSHYFRNQLTSELLLRYLNQDRLEQSLSVGNQQRSFVPATETVTI